VIGSDSNAGAAARDRGAPAQFVGDFEGLLEFQSKMAEVMLKGFASQLKLMHSLMMGPSMAWLGAGGLHPQIQQVAAAAAVPAIEAVELVVATASNVMGPEVLPARRKARKAKAEKRAI
jgi:hypothetical protein